MKSPRGFIQIPIFIVIFIGIAVLGGTSYVAYEVGQGSSQNPPHQQIATTTVVDSQTAISTDDIQQQKTEKIVTPPFVTQAEQSTPIESQTQPSISASVELLIEKCKAERDASRANLWPLFLETVKLAEEKTFQSRIDALMEIVEPGTVPASYLASTSKISDAEHKKNLETAESAMNAQLAKEYSICLESN